MIQVLGVTEDINPLGAVAFEEEVDAVLSRLFLRYDLDASGTINR